MLCSIAEGYQCLGGPC